FPSMQDATKVSVGGGGQPQWRSDQRELFYLSLERAVMSVQVGNDDAINPLTFGPPRQLFRASIAGDPGDARDFFAANADGTRFLIDHALRDEGDQAITVMVNWSGGTDASDGARLSRLLPEFGGTPQAAAHVSTLYYSTETIGAEQHHADCTSKYALRHPRCAARGDHGGDSRGPAAHAAAPVGQARTGRISSAQQAVSRLRRGRRRPRRRVDSDRAGATLRARPGRRRPR